MYQLSICRPYSENKMEMIKALSENSLLISDDLGFDWNIEAMIGDNDGRYISSNIVMSISSHNGIHVLEEGKQMTKPLCEFSLTEKMYYTLSQQLREVNSLMSLYSQSHSILFYKHNTHHHLLYLHQ